jgi:hypothetical protein
MHATREFAFYVLGRAAYGASAASLQELQSIGFPAWVEEQLHPRAADPAVEARLASARLHIKYPAGDGAVRHMTKPSSRRLGYGARVPAGAADGRE